MLYWPMAIVYVSATNVTQTLFTYEGCSSIEEAKDVINRWKDNFTVLCAYVHDNDRTILFLENYVNTKGVVDYARPDTLDNTQSKVKSKNVL